MVHENQFADRIKVVYEKTSSTFIERVQEKKNIVEGMEIEKKFCIIFSEVCGSKCWWSEL